MDYYGAGADVDRMRADANREQILMEECLLVAVHNSLTREETEVCDDFHWACYGCPFTETKGSYPIPEIIIESLYIVTMQDMNREMKEAESMYQEYKRREDDSLL